MSTRMDRGANIFPDGSLTNVVYHNFLTFDDLVFLPGPNLNVIIGPNGNGKSTIICGICLAVGGDPKILGRSAKLGDYVKHGCSNGFVEVCIRDSKRDSDLRAKIVINRAKNAAEYYVNGAHVSRAELRRRIASYNIQIDNPCTFLAQDKVRSFAEQDPYLLLKNTEKASSLELVHLHDELEELKENGAKQSETYRSLQRRVAAVVNELDSLESIVKNYEERKKALEKIETLEKKDACLEYNEAVVTYSRQKSRLKAKKRELEQTVKAMGPIERELQEKNLFVEKTRNKVRDLNVEKQRLNARLDAALSSLPLGTRLRQAREDYERVKKEHDSWEREVTVAKGEVNFLTEKLASAEAESSEALKELATTKKEYEAWRTKEDKLASKRHEINELYSKLRREKDELERHSRKRKQFEEDKRAVFANNNLSRKLNCLDAWRYYEEHKSDFQYPVYVPLLSMNLKSAENAKYLENVIGYRDYLMFIFGSKEDEFRLTNSSFPWKINSTVLSPTEVSHGCKESGLPEALRPYGFHCMASELYDAPASVKAYLNNLFKLDKIPIGGAETENRLDETCEAIKSKYHLFLTNVSRVQINVSRYGGKLSIRTDILRTNTMFLIAHVPPASTNEGDIQRKLAKLKEQESEAAEMQKNYDIEKKEIDMAIETQRRKMAELRKSADNPSLIRQQLRRKEVRLIAMEENKPDLKEAERALKECKVSALDEAHRKSNEIAKFLSSSGNNIKAVILAKVSYVAAKEAVENLNDRIAQFRLEIEEKRGEHEDCERDLKLAEHDISESSKRLKTKAGISSTEERKLDRSERQTLNELMAEFEAVAVPDDREELRSILTAEKARLVAMQDEGGKKDLDRYQQLLEAHEELKRQLEGASETVETWEDKMDRALAEWLSRLEELISSINRNFEGFFRRLGCSGEICLEKPPDKRNIRGYGIDIMVKFRDSERLRRLTHQAQSGGERSVTTMLYLLALQELCPVPFRCVDEINQGMDPTNERLVFDMMVSLLSGVGNLAKTQYFLLTPKLLPGLQYGDKSVIHCIYNGATLPKQGLDIAEDMQRARALAMHA